MAVDNTHTKYLHGTDKKQWGKYKDALEVQQKFDNFMKGLDTSGKGKNGRYDIPYNKGKKK